MAKSFLSVLLLILTHWASSQSLVLKGTVRGDEDGKLPQAHILLLPDSSHHTSDGSGQFTFRTTPGQKTLQISFVGYESFQRSFYLRKDTTLSVTLKTKVDHLKEVVVVGERNTQEDIFNDNQTSRHVLTRDDLNAIPVLGGEADVIKTLQLLPGVVRGVDGSSDLFVRGGAADQNLVLLDDAPIYNTSHLFGFLSVFNPDVLDHVEALNGGFPAQYGGRLSSILNVRTRSLIPEKTGVSGDVGILASRLFIEQPIVKKKLSFWVAGRRTYIDKVVRLTGERLPYFFYDLNGKILWKPSANDNVEFSYYHGEDLLDYFRDRNGDGRGYTTTFGSGNSSQSLHWNHRLKGHWQTDVSLLRTQYNYHVTNIFEDNQLLAFSDIEDYGARVMISNDTVGKTGAFKAGAEWTHHNVSPNVINTAGSLSSFLESSASRGRVTNEMALHAQYEWAPAPGWRLNAGIRGSAATVTNKTYIFPEPRVSARYALSENQALKLSYSRMAQYMHRISNSAISSPTDIWYPVTDTIKPQTSHQVALAWQRNLTERKLFVSVEGYYKSMRNLIGYEEGTNLFLNADFQSKLIQGRGRSYGLEFLVRKDAGKLTGWISYTLSWSWRQFDQINGGEWFHARYDRRHNGAIVAQYAFTKRWAVSVVWEFISGARFTPIIGQYAVMAPTLTGVDLVPLYTGVNQVKLADTHRLDVGIKYRSRQDKKFQWHWFAGVYNAYNRANPIGMTIVQNETDGSLHYEQPGLFGLIPFISYGFKF
ncbi:MAG TPA: carboxypeptidase-like regulatory domain-containing protein [Chryseolinea sp.]